MKWIGIIFLAFSMSEIYPITDWKSAIVLALFSFGLTFYVYGAIEEDR